MTDKPKIQDNEPVFDEQIKPLLQRIQGLCIEHGIPMLCAFQLTGGVQSAENPRGGLMCNARVVVEGETGALTVATAVLEHGDRVIMVKGGSLAEAMAMAERAPARTKPPGLPN